MPTLEPKQIVFEYWSVCEMSRRLQASPTFSTFDENAKRFQCCFCFHVRYVVIAISICELIIPAIAFNFLVNIEPPENNEKLSALIYGCKIASGSLLTSFLIAAATTLFGIYRGRPRFLFPHLLLQVSVYTLQMC